MAGNRQTHFLVLCGIFVLAFALYLPSMRGDFLMDDRLLLLTGRLEALGPLTAFTDNTWNLAGAGRHYRPVFGESLALDRALWGPDPAGYHLTNMLAHAALAGLFGLWLLGRELPWKTALAISLLFAAHPAHVESVSWICGRTDLLAALFATGALVAAQRGRAFACGALFFLALGSKEVALAFLLAAPFAAAAQRGWSPWQRVFLLGAVPSTLLYLLLRLTSRAPAGAYPFSPPASFTEWLVTLRETLTIGRVYLESLLYARRIPFLAYDEILAGREKDHADWSVILGRFSTLEGLLSLLVLAAAAIWAFRFVREKPSTSYGIMLAAISIAMSLNLTSASGAVMFNERYLFVATLGLLLAVAEAEVPVSLLGVLTVVAAVVTVGRQAPYLGPETFVDAALVESPRSPMAHEWKALWLLDHGDRAGARRHLEAAVAASPRPHLVERLVLDILETEGLDAVSRRFRLLDDVIADPRLARKLAAAVQAKDPVRASRLEARAAAIESQLREHVRAREPLPAVR